MQSWKIDLLNFVEHGFYGEKGKGRLTGKANYSRGKKGQEGIDEILSLKKKKKRGKIHNRLKKGDYTTVLSLTWKRPGKKLRKVPNQKRKRGCRKEESTTQNGRGERERKGEGTYGPVRHP